MTGNVGTLNRIVRTLVGLILVAYALGYVLPNTGWNWVGWIGVVPIVTAIFGICPSYSVLGLSTRSAS